MSKPQAIVNKMMSNDWYSQWLGIKVINLKLGYCKLTLIVREEFLNGFGIAHGGISFALADSAFAFASNSHGRYAVSIETSISHLLPIYIGDILTAEAKEQNLSNRTGLYYIDIYNQNNKKVAAFRGTVYRKDTLWEV